MQHADGYWHAPLEANVGMDAQYIIFNRFMGRRPAETGAAARRPHAGAAVDRRQLAALRRRPRPREHDHRGVLRDEARGAAGRAIPRCAGRARVHPGARWPREGGRLHALLPRATSAQFRAGGAAGDAGRAGAAAAVVPHQHLRALELGARDGGAPDRAGGASSRACRSPRSTECRSCGFARRPRRTSAFPRGASLVSWRERLPR